MVCRFAGVLGQAIRVLYVEPATGIKNQARRVSPAGLADLPLVTLELSGNQFTGCIPEALRSIRTHDLDRLDIIYCDAGVPDAITDLSTSRVSSNQVNLTWTRPASEDSPITGYRLQRQVGGGEFEDVTLDIAADAAGHRVGQLRAITKYTFRIAAVNATGQGEWSNRATATTRPGLPDRITEVTAETRGETSITLRWQAPKDNGSAITGYLIQRRTLRTDFVDVTAAPVPGTPTGSGSLEFADTGLNGSSEYIYWISAVNGIGPAVKWSREASASTTLLAPPGVSSLEAIQSSSTHIVLIWEPGTGDNRVENYEIQRLSDTGTFIDVARVLQFATSHADTGLTPDTTYTYRIRATNLVGASAWSGRTMASTLPSPTFSQESYSYPYTEALPSARR